MLRSQHSVIAPMTCLQSFIECVELHRLFRLPLASPSQELAAHLYTRMHHQAAIEWCKVFGSHKEDTHWTHAVPSTRHDAVRQQIAKVFEASSVPWETYRKQIQDQRDQVSAHHDLDAQLRRYPVFDEAIEVAVIVYSHLAAQLRAAEAGDVVMNLQDFREARRRQFKLGLTHLLSGRAQLANLRSTEQ